MDIATLTNLEKKDRRAYEQSLKRYRDLKNALDASEQKGLEKGKMEVLRSGIMNLYKENMPISLIAKVMETDEGTVMRILKEEGLLGET